jgi:Beta-propeller repeat
MPFRSLPSRRAVCATLALVSELAASAQALQWAVDIGGQFYDEARGITTDAAGNVYVTGLFEGEVDFDQSAAVFNMTSSGGSDIFFAKYSNRGDLIWSKAIGGPTDDQGYGIAVDPAGNVYVSGIYTSTADMDPSAGNAPLTSVGNYDIFFCKYDRNGDHLWAKSVGSAGADESRSIAVDDLGQVYVAGEIAQTADLDAGPGVLLATAQGPSDVFFAKYASNGDMVWARTVGGTGEDRAYEVAIGDSGEVYLTGYYDASADFDPSAGTMIISAPNQWSNIFLARYTANGDLVWVNNLGGSAADSGRGLALAPDGSVVVSGRFGDTMDMDPSAGVSNLVCTGPNGDADMFLAKYAPNGEHVWSKAVGGTDENMSRGVAVDGNGNIYVAGRSKGTMDLDPGPGQSLSTAVGEFDMFLAKYNANGAFVWGFGLGSTYHERGLNVATDGAGSVFMTGWYTLTVDFDPSPGVSSLTSEGHANAFLVKYADHALQAITLELDTDADPENTGWELYAQGALQPTFSSASYAEANAHLTERMAVPEGCYRLLVTDNGGDGIGEEGYTLKDANGKRVIDANGEFNASSQIDDYKGPCFPIGTLRLRPVWCDNEAVPKGTLLKSTGAVGATQYQFWLFDPHGDYDAVVNRNDPTLPIYQNAQVPVDRDLNVRVSAKVNGTFGPYGPACRLRFVENQLRREPEQDAPLEELAGLQLEVFPNPSEGMVTVSWQGMNASNPLTLELYSALGALCASRTLVPQEGEVQRTLDLKEQMPMGVSLLLLRVGREQRAVPLVRY